MIKRILLGLLIVFAAIQFIRPAQNLAPATGPNDITTRFPVSPEVRQILEMACFDCHSNHTRYPWYANVQPAGWFLAQHVNEAKRHLNFSEFATYKPERATRKLEQAIDEVKEGGMPLGSYTLLHPDARLTPAQIQLFVDWAEAARRSLAPPAPAHP